MEKRNTILLSIIAIATLLVAVVGATFAYFASNINTNSNVGVNVNTSKSTAAFVATAGKGINITVDSVEMQQNDAGDGSQQTANGTYDSGLTDNSTLNVTLLASENDKETTCTYDVIFTWDDKSKTNFAEEAENAEATGSEHPSEYYIRTEGGVSTGFKELTIEGDISAGVGESSGDRTGTYEEITETNIDEFKLKNGDSDKKVLVLKEGQQITSVSTSNPTYHNYTFTVKFYNLNKDQTKLMGKTFAGTISVDNVHC